MDLTDYIDSLGGAAGSVLGALNKKPAAAAPAATSSSGLGAYLPWIIGGGLILVVVLFVLGRK